MQDGKTALHVAAGSHYDGVKKMLLLIENGVDVTAVDKVIYLNVKMVLCNNTVTRLS